MANQQKPIQPPKEIVWMKCRVSENCRGNQAYISMLQPRSIMQGGGTSFRYRCTTCNGVWHITR